MTRSKGLFRADVYRILASAFSYPSLERVQRLRAVLRDLLAGEKPGGADGAVWDAARALRDALRGADEVALGGEYNRLFATTVSVPPYESSYGLEDKGVTLSDVAGFYRAFGLNAQSTQGPPDSIGHELEFMSIMALKRIYAEEAGTHDDASVSREAELAFLREHLGRWFHLFVSSLKTATRNPFYLSAADLLERWIRNELKELGVEPLPILLAHGKDS